MADWWQQPYAGGRMVPVPGFPRQLQVGDQDGPDVIGYKRTVWRAGRWEGPASRFDDSYSDAFAHGTGGKGWVGSSGVAGVQRQQNMPDTGVVDEHTFNTLRSIRVPEGPHEGELAMDANAANLIAEAYAQFHPPPAPKQTVREKALDGAIKWLGYTENPAGSNNTEFGRWYGMNSQPWCSIFATYCFEVEAGGSPTFERGSRYAYVPYVVSDAGQAKNGLTITSKPQPGDLACYDWSWDGTFDHVELFSQWTSQDQGAFETIGGNTSPDDGGSQSNGGGVYRRQRNIRSASIVFVRVSE
jgi:hypothetical protein